MRVRVRVHHFKFNYIYFNRLQKIWNTHACTHAQRTTVELRCAGLLNPYVFHSFGLEILYYVRVYGCADVQMCGCVGVVSP